MILDISTRCGSLPQYIHRLGCKCMKRSITILMPTGCHDGRAAAQEGAEEEEDLTDVK